MHYLKCFMSSGDRVHLPCTLHNIMLLLVVAQYSLVPERGSLGMRHSVDTLHATILASYLDRS